VSTGIVCYGGLTAASVILVLTVYQKTKNKLIFLFHGGMAGFFVIVNYGIYVWGEAYVYKPGILASKFDTQLGAMASDWFALPSMSVVLAVYRLGWKWGIGASAFFFAIEEWFIKLGIYEHVWWRSVYTFLALPLCFYFGNLWFRRLNGNHGRTLTFWTLFSILYATQIFLNIIIYGVMISRSYHVQWIAALGRDPSAINTLVSLLYAVVFSLILTFRARSFWIVCGFLILYCFDLLLKQWQIVQTHSVGDYLYIALAYLIPLFAGKRAVGLLKRNS
jgi:hypothetical protein